MKTVNKLTVSAFALLFAAMAPVHAADKTTAQTRDMTQTREMSQDRVQINLRTPASDFDQVQDQQRNREQHREQQQSKNQHQNRMMERSMHDISVNRAMSGPASGGGGKGKGR